ncbi:MAG: DUF4019 domain-containing protein [Methylocapsa sp.]|nr:DUF4019 domain-containing protein [Methylocapsa sp.]
MEVLSAGALISLIGAVLLSNFTSAAMNVENRQAAIKAASDAAEDWLALVDKGQYAEAWDAASPLLQNAVPEAQFDKMVSAARRPLGKSASRGLKSARYAASLPGAPDGEYVVIQFAASFENKKSAIETVTSARGADGKWRVSGYYIK